jgi:hypothetical protein
MIRLTRAGKGHVPRVPHHFASWGAIRELLRVNGGAAQRQEIVDVLQFCSHPDPKFRPNVEYLDYAIRRGWLVEI